jgi:N,N'-diacetyllegionaminate synthase
MKKNKTFIIAEVGVNHNGNIDTAKKLIIVAKKAGCDFVKFQSYKSENLVQSKTNIIGYQKKNLKRNLKQIDMLRKYQLTASDHSVLIDFCKKKKIKFLSSPFDTESLKLLFKLKVLDIKIASGEITHYALLNEVAKKAKRVFLSSGMSNLKDIKNALSILTKYNLKKKDLYVLHCHSDYPTEFKDVNLNAMKSIKKNLQVNIGYSDHTLGFETAISSIAMGAKVIEKHITLSKKMRGPDHPASMEPKEFYEFVKSIRNTEKLLGNNIKKPTKKELGIRKIIRKSIVAKFKINKGEKFSESNIISKRPEGGISSLYWNRVIGKKAKINFKRDDFIKL